MSPTKKKKPTEKERVSMKEFIAISKWVFSIMNKINPLQTKVFAVTSVLREVLGIVDMFVIAKILDLAIDSVATKTASLHQILPYFGFLLGFNILKSFNYYFRSIALKTIGISTSYKLRRELYWKMKSLGIQATEDPEINNKLFRARNDLNSMRYFFEELIITVSRGIDFLVTLVIIGWQVPILVPVVIIFGVPQLLNDRKYQKLAWRFGFDETENNRKAWASAADLSTPSSLHEIFLNGAHKFLDKIYSKYMDWATKARIDLRKEWHKRMYAYYTLDSVGTYLGYLIVFWRFIKGLISVGDIYFLIRLVDRLSSRFDMFVSTSSNLFEFSLRFKDSYALFNAEPAFEEGTIELPRFEKGPQVTVQGVSFKYPKSDTFVLKNINLHINPGEKVAIVGHNGAGKTTLVKLLSRMYQVDAGNITINGENINDIQINSLYKNMGVLFQDYNTYNHLTVRDNVVIGRPLDKPNEKEMVAALNRADALDFVNDLPKKFDQILSEKYEGGIRLSTGMWQKLAIARFFYRNAPFVIFDEPTAAIDAVSEYNIFNKIYSFFKDKTVIIISHRFSTVRNADRIVVLNKGKIAEEGTHKELMEKDGLYAKSFKLQAEGYSIAGDK